MPRVIFSRGFDYWESGMDLYPGLDMYDSFCNYQTALLAEFDRLSSEFNFQMVDAARDAKTVCEQSEGKYIAAAGEGFAQEFYGEGVRRAGRAEFERVPGAAGI